MTGPPVGKETAPPEAAGRAASQNTLKLDGSPDTADDDEAQECCDFDWRDDAVVVRQQEELAVYPNPYGAVVLRQRIPLYGPDVWVYLDRRDVPAVVHAILEAADLTIDDLLPGQPRRRRKDATAAERQRRYRDRRREGRNGRNGSGDRNVPVEA